jgi:hypothetical protein
MKNCQINEKYNSRAKNHCNRKIALLSILIQLNSFVTKKVFWPPQPKNPGYGTVSFYKLNVFQLLINRETLADQSLKGGDW